MAKDLSLTKWHGITRTDVPWYPTVNEKTCVGCELCFVTCGREVYEIKQVSPGHLKATVEHPYNCMVGCSTCAVVCPTQAIGFPPREIVRKLEKEFKIFKTIHTEAREKRDKATAMADRQKAEELNKNVPTRSQVRIAGLFGEQKFLVQLEEFIARKDCDIVNLQLHVPTLKGMSAQAQAPAYMDFELVSTVQEDIQPFLAGLKALTAKNHLVWAGEH